MEQHAASFEPGGTHQGRPGVSPSSEVGEAPSGEWNTPSSVSCFAPATQHAVSLRHHYQPCQVSAPMGAQSAGWAWRGHEQETQLPENAGSSSQEQKKLT